MINLLHVKQFIKDTWYRFRVTFAKWWGKHHKKIWYHTRSILDSFFAGVAIDLLANYNTLSQDELGRGVLLGVLFSAVRTGMKMARATSFMIGKKILEKKVK